MNIKAWRDWLIGTDSGIALVVFLVISSIYFATITGVTSSNDGSHYALVRAIVERGTFEINPFWSYTERADYAFVGRHKFSDRPPATALLASTTYALGQVLPPAIAMIPSKHNPDNPRLIYAVGSAALLMSSAATLFFLSLRRHFGVSPAGAMLASLALALGTTYWKYGSVLYSHAAAAFLVWAAIYLIFEAEQQERMSWLHGLGIGLALSASILAEYTNVIFAALGGVYVAAVFGRRFLDGVRSAEGRGLWLGRLGGWFAGMLIPMIFLLIYNTVNFGGPFEMSAYHVNTGLWPADQSLGTQFSASFTVGFPALVWYGSDNQGLFLLSPIALVGLPGLISLFRQSWRRGMLLAGTFAAFLLLVSTYYNFNPLTNDSRYLTTFMGLWFVPVALWLDKHALGRPLDNVPYLLLILLIFALLLLSIRNQFMVIAFSWNHDLDPSKLIPQATPPQNIATIFGTVFRNVANLPLLWLVEALGATAVIAGRAIYHRIGTRAESALPQREEV